ncbi:MAG: gliding motility-associated C-terminal domain-containing protein [Saprospiraceae bacterium]
MIKKIFLISLLAVINCTTWASILELPTAIGSYHENKPVKKLAVSPPDTCQRTAILEAKVNQLYDSIIYTWYYEGQVIDETTATIEAQEYGNYAVDIYTMLDGYGLVTQQTFVVQPHILEIDSIEIEAASCNESNGSLSVKVNATTGIQYSINGANFQDENVFEKLAAGNYVLTIRDSFNCQDSKEVVIGMLSPPVIEKIESFPATCGQDNGRILYEISGGNRIDASINGNPTPVNNAFQELAAGEYTVAFTDEAGCTVDSKISVSQLECPIYIPNVFSPNGDGVNDLFQINTGSGLDAKIMAYRIYNRWGAQLYQALDFPINASDQWWDGIFRNKKVAAGVYVYFIEIEFENGTTEVRQGEVNVVN